MCVKVNLKSYLLTVASVTKAFYYICGWPTSYVNTLQVEYSLSSDPIYRVSSLSIPIRNGDCNMESFFPYLFSIFRLICRFVILHDQILHMGTDSVGVDTMHITNHYSEAL